MKREQSAEIPMRSVGPALITGPVVNSEVMLPLATFEAPLWPSVGRGARVSRMIGGVSIVVADDFMSRSILVEASNAIISINIAENLKSRLAEVATVTEGSSRFAKFIGLDIKSVGRLIFIRLSMQTGDAAGHNMITNAAESLMTWLLDIYKDLTYVSLSANYCTDKKVSAVNSILGRGRKVIAEAIIPEEICKTQLKTTAAQISDLNLKKNLLGSIIAGSVCSANAHFANMLLAFYLATGQDAANIVEGSQGVVITEERAGDLYFSITVPNIIVGTVGNGKELSYVQAIYEQLGCLNEAEPGHNAKRLAAIAGATVWCGELSLLAALTNQGELMRVHKKIERKK